MYSNNILIDFAIHMKRKVVMYVEFIKNKEVKYFNGNLDKFE